MKQSFNISIDVDTIVRSGNVHELIQTLRQALFDKKLVAEDTDIENLQYAVVGAGLVDNIEVISFHVTVNIADDADELKEYQVNSTWTMVGYTKVLAKNINQARRIAMKLPLPAAEYSEYLEDSYDVDDVILAKHV